MSFSRRIVNVYTELNKCHEVTNTLCFNIPKTKYMISFVYLKNSVNYHLIDQIYSIKCMCIKCMCIKCMSIKCMSIKCMSIKCMSINS